MPRSREHKSKHKREKSQNRNHKSTTRNTHPQQDQRKTTHHSTHTHKSTTRNTHQQHDQHEATRRSTQVTQYATPRHPRSRKTPASTSTNNAYEGTARYTTAEKQWLKDEWGDEYHFLRAYRLSIYKDDDREEGRAIVRAYIREDDEDQAEGGLPTADDNTEEPQDEGPFGVGEDDIAYQLAEMHVGEEYGLDPGEYGDDQEEEWEESPEGEQEEDCMDDYYDEYYGQY
jgi:hypothetical protein